MIEILLHAILGKSRLHLASAIIAVNWERVILYGSDEDQFNRFTKDLMGLIRYRIDRTNHLSFALVDKLEFISIPSLDRRENDMLSMIGSLRSRLGDLEGAVDGRDILFYSGTKPHLSLFVSELGFVRIMSFRGDSLVIHTIEDDNKAKDPMEVPIPKWDVGSVLLVHGLSMSNGWIVSSDTEGPPRTNSLRSEYSLELDERSNSKIRIVWRTPDTPRKVKNFCLHVIKLNEALAGSVIHQVANEHLSNWCRNTHLSPPNLGESSIVLSEEE